MGKDRICGATTGLEGVDSALLAGHL